MLQLMTKLVLNTYKCFDQVVSKIDVKNRSESVAYMFFKNPVLNSMSLNKHNDHFKISKNILARNGKYILVTDCIIKEHFKSFPHIKSLCLFCLFVSSGLIDFH